jgi:hypothetical protein
MRFPSLLPTPGSPACAQGPLASTGSIQPTWYAAELRINGVERAQEVVKPGMVPSEVHRWEAAACKSVRDRHQSAFFINPVHFLMPAQRVFGNSDVNARRSALPLVALRSLARQTSIDLQCGGI